MKRWKVRLTALLTALVIALPAIGLAASYSTLRFGSRGTQVKALQAALKNLGFYTGTVDGKYGMGTQNAVVLFQQCNGLTPDGVAGNATQTCLYKSNVTAAVSAVTTAGVNLAAAGTLRFGSSGSAVSALQSSLKSLGYYSGTVDGKYGAGTQTAVRNFQRANGLTADGVAGSKTLAAIQSKQSAAGSESISTAVSSSTASAYSSGTLYTGCTGDEVKTLQIQLKALGFLTGSADGVFGTGTRSAVIAFQQANGLTADGLAGSATRSLIQSRYNASLSQSAAGTSSTTAAASTAAVSSASAYSADTLYFGCSGDEVKTLQIQLKALGYLTGSADGIFGAGTQSAVIAFQSANNLTADGLAGSTTRALIQSRYNASLSQASAASSTGTSASQSTASSSSSSSVAALTGLTRTLRRNSTGDDVKAVQTRLKELGYYTGTVDGSYGSSTIAAVTAFQNANGLTADGLCGPTTYAKMISTAVSSVSTSATITSTTVSGPNGARVQLLHWANSVKGTLKSGDHLLLYDPATGISWTLRVYSRGRHCDCEPLTAEDTAEMNRAFGGVTTWNPKPVYVHLPDGRWTLATTHNTPHESQSIKTNNFNGHLCVHFLRDMSEAAKNDPNYGVQNQNALRAKWKELTGETIQ